MRSFLRTFALMGIILLSGSLHAAGSSVELVRNQRFDAGADGLQGWTRWTKSSSTLPVSIADENGIRLVKITADAATATISQPIQLPPDRDYRIAALFRIKRLKGTFAFYLKLLNASRKEIAWKNLPLPAADLKEDDVLKRFKTTVTLPSEAAFVEIGAFIDASAAEVSFGMLSLTSGADTPDPLDAEIMERFAALPRTVFTADGNNRPAVSDGRFTMNGKPYFFLGGMIWPTLHDYRHDRRWVTGDHPLYTWEQTRADIEAAGFNSIESVTTTRPAARAMRMTNVSWWESDADEWVPFFTKLSGMPLWADFSAIGLGFRYSLDTVKKTGLFPEQTFFKRAHPFSGFNILDPVGRKLYEAHFLTGVNDYLANGMNPFVYELWNEPGITERSDVLAKEFTAYLRTRYASIEDANRVWGTAFTSFDQPAMAASKEMEKAGPFADYMEFLGDAVSDFLSAMKDSIRSVDKRPNVYFAVQPHVASWCNIGFEGIDMFKVARVMDVVSTEGGVHFGTEGDTSLDNTSVLDALYTDNGMQDLMQFDAFRALANHFRVPLVDAEFYIGRRYGSAKTRVPNRAEDVVTAYWELLVRDYDGVYNYSLDGDRIHWNTYQESFATATKARYMNSKWLIPANTSYGTITNANFTFQREFAMLSHFLAAKPRTRAKTALVFSLPTKRVLGIWKNGYYSNDFTRRTVAAYGALMQSQYEIDMLFEEQLRENGAKALAQYRAVIAPVNLYSYRETAEALAAFVRGGGALIASDDSFDKDHYGAAYDNPVKRMKGDRASAPTAFFHPAAFDVSSAAARIVPLLEKSGVRRAAELTVMGTGTRPTVEVHRLVSGAETLMHFYNRGMTPIAVNCRLTDCEGYVSDVSAHARYEAPDGAWSKAGLGSGIALLLPAQRRTLIVVSPDKGSYERYGAKTVIRQSDIPALLSAEETREKERVAAEHALLAVSSAPSNTGNFPANPGRQRQIDIAGAANAHHTAAFAGGPRFATLKTVQQIFNMVMYSIGAQPRNIIALDGARADAPVTVPVNAAAGKIYFLHTLLGDDGGAYTVTYESGRTVSIPITAGETIGRAAMDAPAGMDLTSYVNENLRLAWVGNYNGVYDQAVYALRWMNPSTNDRIVSVTVQPGKGLLLLFGMTAE